MPIRHPLATHSFFCQLSLRGHPPHHNGSDPQPALSPKAAPLILPTVFLPPPANAGACTARRHMLHNGMLLPPQRARIGCAATFEIEL